ncbi:MAG: YIP1 family protein [Holophagaceae bacterium]|nr:YIP1 family protein [Holophagaceae bacterium]
MDLPSRNPYEPPQSDLSGTPEPISPDASRPIPFEDLEAIPGFWRRVGAMFQLLFTNPYGFYDRIPVTSGTLPPLRFMLLMCAPLVLLVIAVISIFGLAIFSGLFGQMSSKDRSETWILPVVGGIYAVMIPVMQFISLWVYGSLTHMLLWIFGGTKEHVGLGQSIRATGYTLAFMTLGSLIPLLNYAVFLGGMVMLGIGLSRIHRTDMWRGILAALLPPFLCCCGYIAIVFSAAGLASAFGR